MISLCVLSATAEPGLFYLTEQLFVCLLQTYKPDLLSPTIADSGLLVCRCNGCLVNTGEVYP